MCVILIAPPKARPELSTLEACARANPHGGGIAWRAGGLVHYRKTDDVGEIHDLAHRAKGEIVIHFRIASIGGVCPELRHPFPVTTRAALSDAGTAKAVLFQNGTWSDWRHAVAEAEAEGHKPPVGRMSDARAAAWLTHIHGDDFLAELEPSRWVLYGSKETTVLGRWHQRGRFQFSNLHWCGGDPGLPPHLQECVSKKTNSGR